MKPADFVHLHVHTDYSLLDGNCRVEDLVVRAKSFGMTALGVSDHGNLFGAVEFYKACKKHGLNPIIGMEGYLAQGSRKEKSKVDSGKNTYHLTLLSQSTEGFFNLMRLTSLSYLEGFYYRPRMDKELLRAHGKGLVALSGCLGGELIQTLKTQGKEGALRVVAEYRDIFGPENYFIEIMDNGLEEQYRVNRALIELARETKTELVATNDIHYVQPDDAEAQDILLCIGTGKLKTDQSRFRMETKTLYVRSGEEMCELFKDVPDALENTRRIADRVKIEVPLGNRFLPAFDPPAGLTSEGYFRKLCNEGIDRLYPVRTPAVEARLAYEADVIVKMGFVDYFLIVWDFIRYGRENGVPVGPGRGSAAGSIVAYSLGITKIDPLRYDLLFERFLNSERISMPDIDVDFCKDGRERVIRYVEQKYGSDRVAQIITFGTMAAKGVIRDVGRALNVPLSTVDLITKKIPGGPNITLQGSIDDDPELKALRDAPEHKELFDISLKIEGCARHSSVHAAGVVITDKPLIERVPLCKTGDVVTTQWTMDVIEEVGLLKMDFLGLRTLTIIDKALAQIKRVRGVEIDIDKIPLEDKPTFELLQRGETNGVFQLESDGMKELLRKLKPDVFEDIIAVLAIYRPGPLGSGMDAMYWKRKHKLEPTVFLHPMLAPILAESYGVILYQEQVMRIASSLAGFSLNEADTLRKAMGKKKPEILAKYKKQFVDGGLKNGVPEEVSGQIWEQIEFFAGYGFNKSHSAAYALVTYQTAWLKANYPIEYMAALLTCEMIAIDKTVEYVEEAKAMKIEILPPDVNKSTFEFAVENNKLRYALGAIKGCGQKAVESLTAVREKSKKPFESLYDLCARVDLSLFNKGVVETLINAGAMDGLPGHRAQKLAGLEEALKHGHAVQEDERSGQMSLFGAPESGAAAAVEAPKLPEAPLAAPGELLSREKEVLGFYLSGHPLDRFRPVLRQFSTHRLADFGSVPDNASVTVGGIVRSIRTMLTKKGKHEGKRMAFVRFEDPSGAAEAVVFASVYGEVADMLKEDSIVFLRGDVDRSREEPSLKVNEVIPLEQAKEKLTQRLTLKLESGDDLEMRILALKRLLKLHPGHVPVAVAVATPRYGVVTVQAGQEFRVSPARDLFANLEVLLGEKALRFN